jgi:hypothetical protein
MVENRNVPVRIDDGFDPATISKEWLDQVINSRIHRRIDGVRINVVDLVATHPGRVAYVVHVPQSVRAPHQAADKRFYKRFNFESVAMEEYEVRDVARRLEAPALRLEVELSCGPWPDSHPEAHAALSRTCRFDVSIINDSPAAAEYVHTRFLLDARLQMHTNPGLLCLKPTVGSVNGFPCEVGVWQWNWIVPPRMPVWEGVRFRLLDGHLELTLPPGPGKYVFGWELHSPRMTPSRVVGGLVTDGASPRLEMPPT